MGLGARDTLEDAKDFVADGGITFPMLWDADATSWRELGVPTQPAALLVATDGTVVKRWSGEFDESEVLAYLASVPTTTAPAPG